MDAIEMACYAMRKDSYIPYTEDFLAAKKELTENIIIKRDLFSKLSEDSKRVIEIVINSSYELVPNKSKLRKVLYESGVPYRKCSKIFKEIASFLKEIAEE